VRRPVRGRVAARTVGALAVVGALAGCGTPANLDHQEQVAFARACASLIERGLSDDRPPRTAVIGTDQLNLDETSSFYSLLDRIRGPSTFNLHDPAHAADTARQPLDACDTKPKPLQSLFPTTTTSTTTTTVPGS
jgi:hypothetical protein